MPFTRFRMPRPTNMRILSKYQPITPPTAREIHQKPPKSLFRDKKRIFRKITFGPENPKIHFRPTIPYSPHLQPGQTQLSSPRTSPSYPYKLHNLQKRTVSKSSDARRTHPGNAKNAHFRALRTFPDPPATNARPHCANTIYWRPERPLRAAVAAFASQKWPKWPLFVRARKL